MRTRTKLLILVGVIAVASAVAWPLVHARFHPEWMEHFSLVGGRARVALDPPTADVTGTLVVTLAGQSTRSGGWGCGYTRPIDGGDMQYRRLASLDRVDAAFVDAQGSAPAPAHEARGRGDAMWFGAMGGFRQGGYYRVLAYRRGHLLGELAPAFGAPCLEPLRLRAVRSRGSGLARQAVEPLGLLFPDVLNLADATQWAALRRLWSHVLPDGRTLTAFVADEVRGVLATIADAGHRNRIDALLADLVSIERDAAAAGRLQAQLRELRASWH